VVRFILSICFLGLTISLSAQKKSKDTSSMKGFTREIDFSFLSSYYEQDGNNGAVTGGIGTEQLTNIANVLTVNIPLDTNRKISLYGGADNYTSASTDNIDNNVSSESVNDTRGFGTITYTQLNMRKRMTKAYHLGFSQEYDYTSFSGGASLTKEWNQANTELTIKGQAFIDNWSLIYPIELRGTANLPSSGRQSYNGQVIFSQILNKRTQIAFSGEFVLMQGLLSTPFHRVYFADAAAPNIEKLPSSRLRVPLAVRLNYKPLDFMVLRTFYRYYFDDFGIRSSTAEIEVPLKIKSIFTVAPFVRYHTQTASKYFAPYKTHLSTADFYTSDYDLSNLSSMHYGVGLKYFPIYGIARSKPMFKNKRIFMFKYISARGAIYERSTGLNGFIASVNLAFAVK